MIVAVTGCIGCGKSTVLRLFEDLGCRTLSADRIVAELYEDRGEVYENLVKQFGSMILDEKRKVSKSALANLLKDRRTASSLGDIVHPAVRKRIREAYWGIQGKDPGSILVVEVPLLFESEIQSEFDATICVVADETEGLKRFAHSRGITTEDAAARSNLQISIEEKARRSD